MIQMAQTFGGQIDESVITRGLVLCVTSSVSGRNPLFVRARRVPETIQGGYNGMAVDPINGATNRCAFSPDGLFLAIAGNVNPFITIYKRDGSTFTKLPNPATLPASNSYDCAFSPDGLYLAVSHSKPGQKSRPKKRAG